MFNVHTNQHFTDTILEDEGKIRQKKHTLTLTQTHAHTEKFGAFKFFMSLIYILIEGLLIINAYSHSHTIKYKYNK